MLDALYPASSIKSLRASVSLWFNPYAGIRANLRAILTDYWKMVHVDFPFSLVGYLVKFTSSSNHQEAFFKINTLLNTSWNNHLSRQWILDFGFRFSISK